MLHWQPKRWFSNYSLQTKITGVSIIGHCGILFSLFVLYRDTQQYHVVVTGSLINADVPIVFLPMHKSLKQMSSPGKTSQRSGTSGEKRSTLQAVALPKKGTIATALPETTSKKKTHKKSNKNVVQKTAKNGSEIAKQKIEPKKKNSETVKSTEPEKIIETPAKEAMNNTAVPVDTPPVSDNQNVVYVGQQEMDALRMQEYLQQEMVQHWSPPAGMRKDISCVIKMAIAFDGGVASIHIEQPSGVMIFDGAAKRAALQCTPPAWAHGKEIVLTFKP